MSTPDVKRKTDGVDWKVPIQLAVSLIVWALLRYTGIDLSAQVEVIAGVVAGALAGAAGPAPRTVPVVPGAAHMESGSGAGV